LSFEDNVPMLL